MSIDASFRNASFPSVAQNSQQIQGAFSPHSNNVPNKMMSRSPRSLGTGGKNMPGTSRSEILVPINRRSNSPTPITVPQQHTLPSFSVVSYRRLGMPRNEAIGLPDFMRIDVNSAKSESLVERMKILDVFMTNFASQFNIANSVPKSSSASRRQSSSGEAGPRNDGSGEDVDQSRSLHVNIQSPSQTIISSVSDSPISSGAQSPTQKRSQTPTIASRNKRQIKSIKANANNKHEGRPGSYVRSKTFDSSLLDNEALMVSVPSPPPQPAATLSLTRKEKTLPLTFSGDVRTPASAPLAREIPELWTTISPRPGSQQKPLSPSAERPKSPTVKLNFLATSGDVNVGGQQLDSKPVAPESANVANIKRLLQANKINVSAPPEQSVKLLTGRSTTAIVAAAFAARSSLPNRPRSISPISRNFDKQRNISPRPMAARLSGRQSPSVRSKSPGRAEVIYQSSRENSLFDVQSHADSAGNDRAVSSKSTKTVRFHLVEDVRFYTPWAENAPAELTASQTPENNGTNNADKEAIYEEEN